MPACIAGRRPANKTKLLCRCIFLKPMCELANLVMNNQDLLINNYKMNIIKK